MTIHLGQSSTPADLRIYAIGDVHGYLKLLQQLYTAITNDVLVNPVADHRIIFLGDYVDRGPDSAGCVEYLIKLMADNPRIICLKGNHEDKLQNFLNDPVKFATSFFTYGGVETSASYGVDIAGFSGDEEEIVRIGAELKEKIPTQHHSYYSELVTTVSFGDYLFTHAGVRPGVALDQQTHDDLIWIRSEFIEHAGHYEKVIVHGHTPAYPMEILPNRINVDTHAYETGVLSCLVLQGKDYRVIEAIA